VQILRERPLRRQVAVVTLSVLIPLLLSAAWSASITRREREAEVLDQVRRTVVHEVGHHFGIGDARLRELGW